jgi:hypothetical protein
LIVKFIEYLLLETTNNYDSLTNINIRIKVNLFRRTLPYKYIVLISMYACTVRSADEDTELAAQSGWQRPWCKNRPVLSSEITPYDD